MRIIFIRHAEPDYENNTLTPQGFREAESLCRRMEKWEIDEFYSSPLERALLTAEPLMKKLGRKAKILDWMHEFHYFVNDPLTGEYGAPWDFYPEYWTSQPGFYDRENWYKEPIFQENPDYEDAVYRMRRGLDELMLSYGYKRTGNYYTFDDSLSFEAAEKTIVIYGHLGANMEAIGYLLGISPIVLQQTTYTAPSSLSILNTEMRRGRSAMFRAQCIGDVTHLIHDGEPISASGAFSSIHQL